MIRFLFVGVVAGAPLGALLVRAYDRSPRARAVVSWLFTFDVRHTDPHLYGRKAHR